MRILFSLPLALIVSLSGLQFISDDSFFETREETYYFIGVVNRNPLRFRLFCTTRDIPVSTRRSDNVYKNFM